MSLKSSHDPMADLPVDQFLTYRIARLQAKLNAQAKEVLARTSGLSLTQWRVLAMIGSREPVRPSDLTRDSGFDKGLFSRTTKSLAAEGLVLATTEPRDHRVQRLTLTPQGRAVFQRTLPTMQARQRALKSSLSEAEAHALMNALEKLEQAADAAVPPDP
ncbi:MAG: MarR family winged helix-turn-helix transcriptional regulator [Pseudomonadota bacterium]